VLLKINILVTLAIILVLNIKITIYFIMKLCIIGDKTIFTKTQKNSLNLDDLNSHLEFNKKSVLSSEQILLQSDHKINNTLNIINNFFKNNNKKCIVVIHLSLTNLFQPIIQIYDEIKLLNSLDIVFITSMIETNNKNRWLIELYLSKKNKHIYNQVQSSVNNMLHMLHYNIDIDHINTQYVKMGSFEILSNYMADLNNVKNKYIKQINANTRIDLETKNKLTDVLVKMII
jgi:K+ transporter